MIQCMIPMTSCYYRYPIVTIGIHLERNIVKTGPFKETLFG